MHENPNIMCVSSQNKKNSLYDMQSDTSKAFLSKNAHNG